MTYLSPVDRAVPTLPDADTPGGLSSQSSLSRRGPYDYGFGEDVVRRMLPDTDPDHWEPSEAFKQMAERYPAEDEPMAPFWQDLGWATVKAGSVIVCLYALVGFVGSIQ